MDHSVQMAMTDWRNSLIKFQNFIKKKKTSLYSTWQNNQLVDGGH
jgi:hypothetical protein